MPFMGWHFRQWNWRRLCLGLRGQPRESDDKKAHTESATGPLNQAPVAQEKRRVASAGHKKNKGVEHNCNQPKTESNPAFGHEPAATSQNVEKCCQSSNNRKSAPKKTGKAIKVLRERLR